jgi:hypothetical protein
MLKRRQNEQEPNAWQAVFTSPLGHLCDPNNTQADLREVFGRLNGSLKIRTKAMGKPWLRSCSQGPDGP